MKWCMSDSRLLCLPNDELRCGQPLQCDASVPDDRMIDISMCTGANWRGDLLLLIVEGGDAKLLVLHLF